MQLGVIGLGRMGANIARRLHRAGHHCVVYNRTAKPVAELAAEGLTPASDILDLVKKLDPPRAVWIMLPAGAVTEGMIRCHERTVECGGYFDRRRQHVLQGRHSPHRWAASSLDVRPEMPAD